MEREKENGRKKKNEIERRKMNKNEKKDWGGGGRFLK
jgi:hypothetical protein